ILHKLKLFFQLRGREMDAIQCVALWVKEIECAAQAGRTGLAPEESNRPRLDASAASPAEFPGARIETGGRRHLKMQIHRQNVGRIGDQKLSRQNVSVTGTPGSVQVHEPEVFLVA